MTGSVLNFEKVTVCENVSAADAARLRLAVLGLYSKADQLGVNTALA